MMWQIVGTMLMVISTGSAGLLDPERVPDGGILLLLFYGEL
jgi:hypothetical protein